jgi:hypothetical protein
MSVTQPKLVCSFGKTQRANAINTGTGKDLTIKYSPAPARHLSLVTRHFFSAFQPSQILQEVVHEQFRSRQALGRHVNANLLLACPARHLSLTTRHFCLLSAFPTLLII